ncbi:MAG: UDP-glucose 4-epimerase GalE [Ahrensia sp.]
MTILVTGGAGFIGHHMIYNLLDHGHAVVALDDLSTGHGWAVPGQATLIVGDSGDKALVGRIIDEHGVTAIFHFAGSIVVPDSVADPLGYYFNNTVKSHALIETAVKHGVRHFVLSSTAAVYGTYNAEPVSEDTALDPASPYGRSKLMTEMMLRDACSVSAMSYGILRYFNVAGADPAGRGGQSSKVSTHLIKIACEVAVNRRDHLSIFGTDYPTADGTCIRDYIHVSDLADVHRLTLQHLSDGGSSVTLNCGYGRGFSVREVINRVERAAGKPLAIVEAARRDGDQAVIIADPSRAMDLLDWTPRFDDLGLIVGHALDWERKLLFRNRTESDDR